MARDALENDPSDTQGILATTSFTISHELDNRPNRTYGQQGSAISDTVTTWSLPSTEDGGSHIRSENTAPVRAVDISPIRARNRSRVPASPDIRKILLMNGYPIAYIVLWIPGIANRLAESTGGSPRWLAALQSSTQFVGLANALTYGFNEQLRRQMRKRTSQGKCSRLHD